MPRIHRRTFNIPGEAHELTFSCYHRLKLLNRDRTRNWLRDAINEARDEHHFDVWAYVFMPEHVHLLVFPTRHEHDVSVFLSDVKQPVARRAMRYLKDNAPQFLESLTVKRGQHTERHFWQVGGGYDRNVSEDDTAWQMIEYIHENPVRRGLVARATDWYWSSARWYAGLGDGPIRIDPMT